MGRDAADRLPHATEDLITNLEQRGVRFSKAGISDPIAYCLAYQDLVDYCTSRAGGQGMWSEEEVDACFEDVYSLLRYLEILPGGNPRRAQMEIVQTIYEEAAADGFWYPAADLEIAVQKNIVLGRLEDRNGQLVQEVRAAFDGVVLYHTIALGVSAGDPLIAYGHP